MNKLTKFIDQEIDFNRRLIKDEKLTTDHVLENYEKIVRENNISFSIDENEANQVVMTIPKEDGIKYILRFDPSQVADSINSAIDSKEEDNEDEGDLEMSTEEADELDEGEFDEDKMPFNITLEIHREGHLKYASIEAEVSPSLEGRNQFDLFISDMFLQRASNGQVEVGPSFDTLDDDLREQFDQLVSKNVRKFIPLVTDYSKAKDAQQYGSWLRDLKEIAAPSKA